MSTTLTIIVVLILVAILALPAQAAQGGPLAAEADCGAPMRFLNILLVCMAIGVLATGAYVLGSKVKRDADDELTTPITASAAAATAESSLKPALYAANAYYVDQFDLPGG